MKRNLGDLQISSPAFGPQEHMPKRYVSDGDNLSPPLEWINAPANTKQFALVCFDPDAPYAQAYTHWVMYGIPADVNNVAEGEGKSAFTEGVNSGGHQGYSGPAPPPGNGPHHYYFWLYALDTALDLEPGLTRRELMDAIEDHITVQARLVAIYEN